MEHASCSRALHNARLQCARADGGCYQKHGVYGSKSDCPCAQPTVCELSGFTETHYACLTAQSDRQIVQGFGVKGEPTRVVRG